MEDIATAIADALAQITTAADVEGCQLLEFAASGRSRTSTPRQAARIFLPGGSNAAARGLARRPAEARGAR